jgi:hypothetical protein
MNIPDSTWRLWHKSSHVTMWARTINNSGKNIVIIDHREDQSPNYQVKFYNEYCVFNSAFKSIPYKTLQEAKDHVDKFLSKIPNLAIFI